jgi:hypothetical protein
MPWMQLADLRQSVHPPHKTMARNRLLFGFAIAAALTAGATLAQ